MSLVGPEFVRVAAPVSLSPEERTTLGRWLGAKGSSGPLRLRASVVLAAADGWTDLEISQRYRVHRLTVARWRRRFLESRLQGLRSSPNRFPHPGRLRPETVQAIVRATTAVPRPGSRVSSTRSLARSFGVSHTTIRRVWEEHGIRPRPFESSPARPDPAPSVRAVDLLAIHIDPPNFALVVRLGDVTTDGRQDVGSAPDPGVSTRPAWLSWTPSSLGREIPRAPRPRGRDGVLRLLDRVRRNSGVPIAHLAAVVRVPNGMEDDRWRLWLSRHPRFRLERASDFEDWKERVARRFAELAAGLRTGGSAKSSIEVTRSLARSLASFDENGGAFEWVARRAEILRGVGARRLRYDLSSTGHTGFRHAHPDPGVTASGAAPADRARDLARAVLRRSLGVRRGEQVTIECWTSTLPYANEMVLEALRLGARPLLLYQDEATYWAATTEVQPEHLARLGEHRRAAAERTDVLVSFFGPSDRERFHALPHRTMMKLCEQQDAMSRAAAKAGARAVDLALGRASPASASMYGVDLATWTRELIDSTLVDPRQLHRVGVRLASVLRNGRELRLTHENGTDLRLRLCRREPAVSDGLVPHQLPRSEWRPVLLPAGVVAVAVDERAGDGIFRSNVTSSVGVMDAVAELGGGEWTFHDGRLVRYRFATGQETFEQSYSRAPAGRERLGSLSIGLNPRTELAPLLEDQGRGTVGLVLGRNDRYGGSNRVNWWSWLYLRGADLSVDGRPVLRHGEIRV